MQLKLSHLFRKFRLRKNNSPNGSNYQALIKYAGDSIFIVNPSFQITDINESACNLVNYSREELLKMKIYELMTVNEQKLFAARTKIIDKEGGSLHERKLRRKDGSLVDTEVNVRPVEAVGYIAIIRDITGRKQIEKELIESEIRFRELLENSLSASYKRNLQTNAYDYLSPVFKKIAGYSQDEMNTMPLEMVLGMIHPDDLQVVKEGLTRSLSGPAGIENSLEYRFRHKTTGEYRWLKDEFNVMRDAQGQAISLIGSVSDITEQKESELKFKNLVENSLVGVYILRKGRLVYVNPTYCAYLGYSEEELLALEDANELVYSEDMAIALENRRKRREEDTTEIHSELRFQRKDGGVIWAEVKSTETLFKGSPAVIGTFQDITERKKAEENIKQSEANYRQLFDNSPLPMWVIDEKTAAIIQVNQACVKNYGYSEKEFLALSITDISPGESYLSPETGVNGMHFMGSQRHVKKSGELIDVVTSSIPITLIGEKKILMTAIDVTEKNLYEQKLAKAAIKAQEEERYEIGGELHDNVCQILSGSLMYLGLMKKMLQPDADELFNQTHDSIKIAADEIRNLTHRLAPAYINHAELHDAFLQLLHSFNANKKYEVSLQVDDAVRNYPLERDLLMNLYRVLQEQLRNILKHANAEKILVDVSIKKGNRLEMKVSDDGIGFDTKTTKGGIGLANMSRRAQLFSGTFTIDSSVGKGCKILVEIPLSSTN